MNTAVSTRLSPALAKQLAAEAGSRKMTSSATVRGIIADHFNNKDITETLLKMQSKLDAIDDHVLQAVDGISSLAVEVA
jgi:hypothetical protein